MIFNKTLFIIKSRGLILCNAIFLLNYNRSRQEEQLSVNHFPPQHCSGGDFLPANGQKGEQQSLLPPLEESIVSSD